MISLCLWRALLGRLWETIRGTDGLGGLPRNPGGPSVLGARFGFHLSL